MAIMYPEKPHECPPESREEDGAVSTLHRGKIWLTAVTEITRNGKTTRAARRLKVSEE